MNFLTSKSCAALFRVTYDRGPQSFSSQGPLRMDTYLQGLMNLTHWTCIRKNVLFLYYLPGNALITHIGNLVLPLLAQLTFKLCPPWKKNDAVSNYLKGTLVLFKKKHFWINYVGVLFIILQTPWPYATDLQGSPDPILRTTDLREGAC